jgi:hypothetical protein
MMWMLWVYGIGFLVSWIVTTTIAAGDQFSRSPRDNAAIGLAFAMVWPALLPAYFVLTAVGRVGKWLSDRVQFKWPG